MDDSIKFTLTVSDANGLTLTRASHSLNLPDRPSKPSLNAAHGEKRIVLSALSKEIVALLKGVPRTTERGIPNMPIRYSVGGPSTDERLAADGRPGPTVSKAVRDSALAIGKIDFLATVPQDVLNAIVRPDTNVIASVPDSLIIDMARTFGAGTLSVSQALKVAQSDWGLTVEDAAGWLTLRPKAHATAIASRTDRASLATFLKVLGAGDAVTLAQRAAYAATQPESASIHSIDSHLMRWVNPVTAEREFLTLYGPQSDILKLYGLLSSGQREALVRGQRISVQSLSPNQRKALDRIVWDSADGPRVEAVRGRGAAMMMDGVMSERTQLLPSGLTSAATITCSAFIEPMLVSVTESGDPIVMQRLSGGGAAELVRAGQDRFRTGRQTTLQFRFNLANNVSMTRVLSDSSLDAGKAVPYDQLPADVRRALEASPNVPANRRGPPMRGGVEVGEREVGP